VLGAVAFELSRREEMHRAIWDSRDGRASIALANQRRGPASPFLSLGFGKLIMHRSHNLTSHKHNQCCFGNNGYMISGASGRSDHGEAGQSGAEQRSASN